ncbi:uncharacterized protein LOC131848719 [Achroia grisella]|uniref:uncharacterized protein LOC131848719 n=1 Tax=Achroia grisella TaxID=688607 RepID=UPI0027D26DE0|nr:uncharacterized protein LOC131848719 [Achroia grisella]
MFGRNTVTVLWCFVLAGVSIAQNSAWIDIVPNPAPKIDAENHSTRIIEDIRVTRDDVQVLHNDYATENAVRLADFLSEMSGFVDEKMKGLEKEVDQAPDGCRDSLEKNLNNVEYNARRLALFNAENHHKFLLGHLIVLRMHLIKSEELITRYENIASKCGILCENSQNVKRWRRNAVDELDRAKMDLKHSRRCYRDIVTHARRRLHHIRKQADNKAETVINDFRKCSRNFK